PLLGTATALETLCSQSFTGARRHDPHLTGVWLQRALVIVTLLFLLVEALLWDSTWLMTLLAAMVARAVPYLRWHMLYLYTTVVTDSVKRFLFAQGIRAASVIALSIGVPVGALGCHILVVRPETSIGITGVPIALMAAYLVMLAVMVLYVRVTGCGRASWGGWSRRALEGWGEFARLAVPSCLTVTAEFAAMECVAIGATRFGTLALAIHPIATTSLKLCVNMPTHPVGIASAARVGHMLGHGDALRARRVAWVGAAIGSSIGLVAAVLLYEYRHAFAAYYSSSDEVVAAAVHVLPSVAAAVFFLGMNTTLDGILRGQGRQAVGFYFKLVAFGGFALPLGHRLAFVRDWGIVGLWTAFAAGCAATAAMQLAWLVRSDWQREVELCKQRL
ncbi:hypothetical protein GQ42DRAFT_114920, partial [Ramicandelaber brevisporus]